MSFPGFRRLTLGFWAGSVKEIRKTENPLPRAELAGFPGARRLTRDYRIPAYFFVKKFWKNCKNRFFGLPGPK